MIKTQFKVGIGSSEPNACVSLRPGFKGTDNKVRRCQSFETHTLIVKTVLLLIFYHLLFVRNLSSRPVTFKEKQFKINISLNLG